MRIGILGAGQLGRMMASAAYRLGHSCTLYTHTQENCPGAGDLLYDPGTEQLSAFLNGVDCVTYEHEHLPIDLVKTIEQQRPVYPGSTALSLMQDRVLEKQLLQELNIPTARYRVAETAQELREAVSAIGTPAIVKRSFGGYDGKGQAKIESVEECDNAWSELGGKQVIVEGLVPFETEVSVIACRDQSGNIVVYPPSENIHRQGILWASFAPTDKLQDHQITKLNNDMTRLLEHLDYVGVLALELFLCEGQLIANEMAPRVHNSGHWTMDGAQTSQFENHIRAITGLPLGSTEVHRKHCMINILGESGNLSQILGLPFTRLYMYNKSEKPRRKLGHINIVADSNEELRSRVSQCEQLMSAEQKVI